MSKYISMVGKSILILFFVVIFSQTSFAQNNPPILASIGSKTVDEGQTLEFWVVAVDLDGDSIVLSAVDIPTNATFIDSGNGGGSFTFNPDYTQDSVYYVTFIASDTLLADSEVVEITVNDVNRAPVLDSIRAKSVDEGQTLEFRISATDPDGTIPTLDTANVPLNATFVDSGNGAGSFTFNPDYTQDSVYYVTFIASDTLLADSEVVEITVNDVNRAPVADAGSDQSGVEAGSLVVLDGSGSYDPDGDSIGYHWLQVLGPSVSLSDTNVVNPSFTPMVKGDYEFELLVDDSILLSLPDTVLVSVSNQSPVADAGTDQLGVVAGNLVTLDGSGSTDPDGDSIGYHWLQVSGPSVSLSDTNVVNPTFTPGVKGSYEFELLVDDSDLTSSPDTVLVSVDNQAPVLDSIRAKTVDEGQTLEFRISATDPDGTIPTLDTANVPLNATFVDSGNGAGSFTFNPDYTQDSVYYVTFIASDTLLADSEVVEITVNDVNRAPVADAGSDQLDVEAGSLVVLDGSGSYDPDGDSIGYHWLQVLGPSVSLSDTNAVNPTFTPSVKGDYEFELLVDDSVLMSLPDTVLVQVGNQAPVLDSIRAKTVDEGQGLEFGISATDPDGTIPTLDTANVPLNAIFVDSGNGAGSFTFNPDYTQDSVYNVTFIASDTLLADSEVVEITVNDVNRAPVLDSIRAKSVDEGQTLEFRVSATDPDLDSIILLAENVPVNATFVDSGNGAGSFTFNPDYTQDSVYYVTFIASDGALADSEVVQITVDEVGNQAPVLDSIGPQFLYEGDSLTLLISATDPDGPPPILGINNQPPNSSFIDSGNGKGVFNFKPDFYQADIESVTFIATEDTTNPLSDLEIVAITIWDVNQPPYIDSIGPKNVVAGDTLEIRVAGHDPTDPDGGPLYLTAIGLPQNSTFHDSGGGVGGFIFTPDESQVGMDTVNFYCTDAEDPPLTGSETMIITINEGPNQAPVLDPIGYKSVTEAETLSFVVSASDPDGTTPVLYTSQPLPQNAVFVDSGNGRGSFVFTPDYAQQGLKEVTFYASDGELIDYEDVIIQVIDAGNQKPILDSIGPKSVTEADTLIFLVSAVDPDSTIPYLSVDSLPINASFEDSGNGRGVFIFTPVYVQSGVYNLNFIASDEELADSELVAITVVEAGNQMPVLSPIDSQVVAEDGNLTFVLTAVDPDSTIPTLKANNLPNNATFTDNLDGTGSFEFNPDYFQAGVDTVIFEAVDAEDTLFIDSLSVQITVTNVNRLPQIQHILAQSVYEGDTLIFNVVATDLDLTIPILDYGPQWVNNTSFVDSGNGVGTFTFYPDYSQAGFYYFGFMAIDAEYPETTTKQVQISVYDVPQPPSLLPIPDTSVIEGDTLTLTIWSTDPDNMPPALTALEMPLNSQFVDNGDWSGTLTFMPNYVQADTYWVTFVATDPTSLTDSQEIQIMVLDGGNQPPEIIPIDSQYIAGVEKLLSFTISATDPDSTIPSFTSGPLPANADLYDSGNGTALFTFVPDSTQADSLYQIILIATDGSLADSFTVNIEVIAYLRGDANFDGVLNLGDVIYLANYLLKGGPKPYPMEAGDVNADGNINLGDVIYLANYLLKGGPAPPLARFSISKRLLRIGSIIEKN